MNKYLNIKKYKNGDIISILINDLCNITPFSLKIGTLNYLVFSSYLFTKSLACINK